MMIRKKVTSTGEPPLDLGKFRVKSIIEEPLTYECLDCDAIFRSQGVPEKCPEPECLSENVGLHEKDPGEDDED